MSLYRTPLLQSFGFAYFTQHWDDRGEFFGPARSLIDDCGNRASPIELFEAREESLNNNCLNVCVYPTGKYGILNKNGSWMFPPIYESIKYSGDVYLAEMEDESDNPYNTCAQGKKMHQW
mgnify:CR=1 FL=1